jgi:hypothetical protein
MYRRRLTGKPVGLFAEPSWSGVETSREKADPEAADVEALISALIDWREPSAS